MKKGFKKLMSKIAVMLVIIGMVLVNVMPIQVLARTILPVEETGDMHVWTTEDGKIHWDKIDEASSYTVKIYRDGTNFVLDTFSGIPQTIESTIQFDLYGEMDNKEYAEEKYRIEVTAVGAGKHNAMIIYYNSPYSRLAQPTNLRWNGNTAEWDAVPNATSYHVLVYRPNIGNYNVRVVEGATSVDLSYLSPEDGNFFTVLASADGYRDSYYNESPKKGGSLVTTTYSYNVIAHDITNSTNAGGTVTITTDKGTDNGLTVSQTATENSNVELSATPASGYEFVGWKIGGPEEATVSTNTSYSFDAEEDLYIYAIFQETATTYTINVVAIPNEGGTVSVTTDKGGDTATENSNVTINAIPNEGYEFVAWKKGSPSASDNFATSANYSFDATESVWLYAIFQEQSAPEPETWTVTFNSKGGSDVPSQTGIANNGTATQPANPTRTGTGYTFGGWYVDEDCVTTPFDFSTPITANITIYAKWIPTEITSVSATVTLPVAGQHPVLTGTPGNSTYSIFSVNFYDKDSHQLTTSDTFEAGETYDIYVSYRPVTGYDISTEATATVNGETAIFQGAIADGYGTIVYKLNYTVPAAAPTYTIIEGDNQTYTKGSNENIVIKASGDVSKISSIEIDGGNVIDPANYELTPGSTVLTLKSSFLENSSVGTHTITFKYNDGEVDATLIVAEATNNDNNNNNGNNTGNNTNENTNGDTTNNGNSTTSNNPHTADNIVAYVYELILSIIVVAGGMIYIKRKKVFGNK